MPFGNVGHKGFVKQAFLNEMARPNGDRQNGGIQAIGLQSLHELIGRRLFQFQAKSGIPLEQLRRKSRNEVGRDRGNYANSQGSFKGFLKCLTNRNKALSRLNGLLGMGKELKPQGRKLYGLASSINQLTLKFLFKLLNLSR